MAGAVSAGQSSASSASTMCSTCTPPLLHIVRGRRQRCAAAVILSRRHVSATDGLKEEGGGERGAHGPRPIMACHAGPRCCGMGTPLPEVTAEFASRALSLARLVPDAAATSALAVQAALLPAAAGTGAGALGCRAADVSDLLPRCHLMLRWQHRLHVCLVQLGQLEFDRWR